MLISVGNSILAYLVDIVEHDIQVLPAKEVRIKREVVELDDKIKEAQDTQDYWDSLTEGSGKDLLKRYKKQRQDAIRETSKMEDMGTQLDDKYTYLSLQKTGCEDEITRLEKERKDLAQYVEKLKKTRSGKTELLEAFRKARKTEHDSMYSGIDFILQKYHIHRAAYHGGDLTGVCIRKLMSSAKEIMNDIEEYLLATKSPSCLLSDANIADLCNDISVLLLCWDGALSKLHTNNPDEEDCLEAQEYIDKAVELMRKLGLSTITRLAQPTTIGFVTNRMS